MGWHRDGGCGDEEHVPVAHAIRSVGIPVERGVAVACRALDGVPGHPAIGLAIDDDGAGFVAVGQGCEVGLEVGFEGRREDAFADVGKPNGPGHIRAGFGDVPGAGRWVCAGAFQRGYVEEDGVLVADEGLQGFKADRGAAGHGGGYRCAVLFDAVTGGRIEVGLGGRWERGHEEGKESEGLSLGGRSSPD